MKKTIALVFALVMCLLLCACGSGKNTAKDNTPIDIVQQDGAVMQETTVSETAIPEKKNAGVAYRFDGTTTGDVTIEEVVVRPHTVGHDGTLYFNWEMKVRNTGDADTVPSKTVMRVWFHYLDENGDIIEDTLGEAGKHSPVKSGQAEWIQVNGRLSTMDSSEVEATAFIEIYAYTKTYAKGPEVFFEEPILVDIREFVKE